MLINTKYKTNIQVSLCLFFDDDSIKEGTLEVGDIVEVTYRRDFKKCKDTGKISNIYIFANGLPTNRETVVLEFDFSDDYESKKRKIAIQDIIDFNIIKYSNGSKPDKPCKPPKPPYKPPHKPPKPPYKPPHKPPYIPDWPIPPCDTADDGNDNSDNDDNNELGHHYTHHTHSCIPRPCPPPRPIKLRSFYVGKNARVGRAKVL